MKPTDFPQSTKVLQRPSTMSESECQSLPVWSDGKQCVSAWKPSFRERLKILFGGKVWLGIISGNTQPPVFISGEEVFHKTSNKAKFYAFISQVTQSISETVKSLKIGFKSTDKCKHFIVGFIISLLIGVFIPLLGFVLGCIAGAIKEYWDKKGHGVCDRMDFVFTCLGALLALPNAWFIYCLIW